MQDERKIPIVVGVTGHREYIGKDTADPLIREMLGENARWYSYKSRGKAEISL